MADMLSSGHESKSPADILDKLGSPSGPPSQASPPVGSSSMMDLLDGFGPVSSVPGMCSPVYVPGWHHYIISEELISLLSVAENNGPTYPSLVAFESSSLRVTFNFSKQPGNPQTTYVEAQFVNKSPNAYSNFVFQAAVPKVITVVSVHFDVCGDGSYNKKRDNLFPIYVSFIFYVYRCIPS